MSHNSRTYRHNWRHNWRHSWRHSWKALLLAVGLAATFTVDPASAQEKSPTTQPLKQIFEPQSGQLSNFSGLSARRPEKGPKGPRAAIPLKPVQASGSATRQQIDEINGLRQRLGGLSEHLQGAVPGADPDKLFKSQLRGLIKNETATATAAAVARFPAGPKLPAKQELTQQLVLRGAAKQLEQLAASMESAALYSDADQLRKMAGAFWQKARTLD